jgi:FlaA1/EpsC-like NDP-sugar epimerase
VFEAQERVLIVGGGESGQFLAWWLHNGDAGRLFRVAGFIDDDLYKQNTRIRGVDVLGRREDIPELVARYDVGLILFAIHNIPIDERRRLLTICSSTPARVMMIPDVLGDLRDLVSGKTAQVVEEKAGEQISPKAIPSQQVRVWLDELGDLTKDEDLKSVLAKIEALKSQIGPTDSD